MTTFVHICPVCQERHEVPALLHGLAYGRQLTCSAHCKAALPGVLMARLSAQMLIANAEKRRSETQTAGSPAPMPS